LKTTPVIAIVVNWKLAHDTIRSVRSLARQHPTPQIMVVDNGSGDGSATRIAAACHQVKIIALPRNVGFGAACNVAMRRVLDVPGWRQVLLLNNDAVVAPGALAELLRAAEAHPEAGILAPKILDSNRPPRIWYAGARRRPRWLSAIDTRRGHPNARQTDRAGEVDYVFGAAMLLRRELIDRIGLFDERFFLYLEDMDYCLRAQAAGFALRYVPQARVWHRGSASTSHRDAMRRYYQAQSMVRFLRKHLSPAMRLLALPIWAVDVLRMNWHRLLRPEASLGRARTYWCGLIDGLTDRDVHRV